MTGILDKKNRLGFGQNLVWEMGFTPPPVPPLPTLQDTQYFLSRFDFQIKIITGYRCNFKAFERKKHDKMLIYNIEITKKFPLH